MVGVSYFENHKHSPPMLGGLHHLALAKPQTIRMLGGQSPFTKYCFTTTPKWLHNPSYQNDRS